MPAGGCRTVKWEMYSRTVLPMFGSVRWRITETMENLKNVPNVSSWPGAEAARQWPAAETEIFMKQTLSAGRRSKQ